MTDADFQQRLRLSNFLPFNAESSLFTDRLFALGFTGYQIVDILGVIENTCNDCWDRDTTRYGCSCENDE